MIELNENDFNNNIKKCFKKLLSNDIDENRIDEKHINGEFYVHLSDQRNDSNHSLPLSSLRLLLLVNFLSKLTNKSVLANISLNEENKESLYLAKLNKTLEIFNLTETFKLNLIDKKTAEISFKEKLDKLDHKYKHDDDNENDDGLVSINFSNLLDDLNLKNYDKNLKICNSKFFNF